MQRFFLFFFVIALLSLSSCGESSPYALVETDMGTVKIKLFESTPLHTENFIKLAKEGFYDDLLFHRVIAGFMIQGGDPNSKGADATTRLGSGGPGYQIPAEIGAYHFRGSLAAARNGNPEKKSSGSQFYIVQGSPVTDGLLTGVESSQKIKYSEAERALYKEIGGAPNLDNQYTVYGEVVEGMDVVDRIAATPKNGERPIEDVKMKVRIVYE